MVVAICIIGFLIGPLLNMLIYRIQRDESILPLSLNCLKCHARLKAIEMLPVVSYVLYKGRCPYCKERISTRQLFVELLNGILYGVLYHRMGMSSTMIVSCMLISTFIIIAIIDFDDQIIPDGLNLSVATLGTITLIINGFDYQLFDRLVGLIIGGGFFLILAIATKGAMGGGDIKLMAALGWYFGFISIIQIAFLSFIFGAIVSVLLLVLKIKGRKDMIPFGPFIVLAATVILLSNDIIIDAYISLF